MISVVTLTHNKLPVTRRCLTSWLGTTGAPWELIVVDNGSDDGTVAWLEAFRGAAAAQGVDARILCNDRNAGCSTARNQGLDRVRGEWVAFIDNDVALRSRRWLSALRETVETAPGGVMAGPKLVYPFPPFDIQCAGVAVAPNGRICFRGRGEPRDTPAWNVRAEVQCLISACCVARTAAVRAAGGFDEDFNPVQFEDFDLCYRLRERGGTLQYDPRVEAYHFESVTTQGTPQLTNAELVIRHGLLFKQRWHHRFASENGPPGATTRWRTVPPHPFHEVGALTTFEGPT